MDYDVNNSLMHQLHRASQLASDLFTSASNDQKLTPRQLVVLATAAAHDGLNQTQIVNLTGVDRSTMTDIIRRMVKAGFLQKNRTKGDARAYSVTITTHGQEAMKSAFAAAQEVDDAFLSMLTGAERDEFRKSLAAVINSISR